jgi:glycosyltransferase involved in cell wall biosynthesis
LISALMLQTSNAGVAWYRLTSWSSAAHRVKAFNAFQPWWNKSLTETHPWELDLDDPILRRRILGELNAHSQTAEVVVSQMVHTRAALTVLEGMKAMYKIPLVTEIDDNILSTPTYNPANAVYGQGSNFRALAIEQFRLSDAMVVSTPYLKEVYSEFCENIYVVPNSLDFRIWDNLKHRRNKDLIRIGWAGGASHDEDLRIIEPVMRKILAKHPSVRFCFVHGIPSFFKGIEGVEAVHDFTRIDRYPQFLASRAFDIGIAPLVDNSFNRGKSNLRWLEYSGLKIPTVASKVGHFAETITQAEDGLLCETEQDWMDSLEWLISDEVARRKIGKNANRKARADFNADSNIQIYREALEEIGARGQVVKMPETQEATA